MCEAYEHVKIAALPDDENNIFHLIADSHEDNLALIKHPYLVMQIILPLSDLISLDDEDINHDEKRSNIRNDEYWQDIIKKYEKGDDVFREEHDFADGRLYVISKTNADVDLDTIFIFTIIHSNNDYTHISVHHNNNEHKICDWNTEINNCCMIFIMMMNGESNRITIRYNFDDNILMVMNDMRCNNIRFEKLNNENKIFKASLNKLMEMTYIAE